MSVEPPLIDLAYGYEPIPVPERMRERLRSLGAPAPSHMEKAVCSTRDKARALIGEYERHRNAYSVIFRCDRVEVVTPSFAHELLKVWPRFTLAGASEEVQISFDVAASDPALAGGESE